MKCCNKEELIHILKNSFPGKTREALRKRCERYLKELEELGLVEKRGEKYCWYIYVNEFKGHEDHSSMLNHSHLLIQPLILLAGMEREYRMIGGLRDEEEKKYEQLNGKDRKLLERCAEDHLRAYPDLWRLLEEWRKLEKDAKDMEGNFLKNVMERLRREIGEPVPSSRRFDLSSFVANNIPFNIYSCISNPTTYPCLFKPEGDELWLSASLVARGDDSFKERVKKFIKREVSDVHNVKLVEDIKRVEGEASSKKLMLQEEVRKLIWKIRGGEPLKGQCATCPEVIIKR